MWGQALGKNGAGGKTRVVEIDRGSSTEFPFSYKVKIGKVCKKILVMFRMGVRGQAAALGKMGAGAKTRVVANDRGS